MQVAAQARKASLFENVASTFSGRRRQNSLTKAVGCKVWSRRSFRKSPQAITRRSWRQAAMSSCGVREDQGPEPSKAGSAGPAPGDREGCGCAARSDWGFGWAIDPGSNPGGVESAGARVVGLGGDGLSGASTNRSRNLTSLSSVQTRIGRFPQCRCLRHRALPGSLVNGPLAWSAAWLPRPAAAARLSAERSSQQPCYAEGACSGPERAPRARPALARGPRQR